jgi:hypothetical protein
VVQAAGGSAGRGRVPVTHPGIDWDAVRATPAGRPSPLARLTATTYHALLRCALGDVPELGAIRSLPGKRHTDGVPVSQLWAAVSTAKDPLRLSWPQVQLWARADRKTARSID